MNEDRDKPKGSEPELSLADTIRFQKKSFNPYEGSKTAKAKVEPKRNRMDTMRALSEEIKRRRALGLPPIEKKRPDDK